MPEYHLPENAEASIIGCLLLCPDTKPAVSRRVNEGDFSPGLNAALFSAALELEEPDSAAFHAAVKRRGYTLPDGFFRELGDIAISRANVELYCSLLRDKAQKRNLSALADEMRASIADDREAAAIISGALSRLGEIERVSKLRKQLAEFVAKVNDGVNTISSMDNAEEIMVEFRECLDASKAIGIVLDRHRRIEEQKSAQEARKSAMDREAETVRRVEALAPPVVVKAGESDQNEVVPRLTFTCINATRAQLRRVREFLNMEGIQYE